MHVLGSCGASAQYSPINFFVNLFHSKNSNLPYCFSDLIHTEYRKLHKNNGHSPFVLPSIMRSSVGQCRNIRFRQLSASHVIITSVTINATRLRKTMWNSFRVLIFAFSETNADIKMASVGQAIIQAARPRVLILPLEIGLAIQLHCHFASKFLIDTLIK